MWSSGRAFHKLCPVQSGFPSVAVSSDAVSGIPRWATYVVTGKVVYIGLGKHGVIFELAFAQRRSVAGNDDQFGFTGAKRFEG